MRRAGSRVSRLALRGGVVLALCAAAPGAARALVITDALPAFDGDCEPLACEVGLFEYAIPAGQTIVGATLVGSFGNANATSTAPVEVFLDGLTVAECLSGQNCTMSDVPLTWRYVLDAAELPLLADGSAALSALQNGGLLVRLGPTTLRIQTVPEPSSALLAAAGLLALAGRRRRKRLSA
jgi:MYXO-CTERM domain-containing protein